MARYRIVFFSTDPSFGDRIIIGALIQTAPDKVSWVPQNHLPGEDYLGRAGLACVRMAQEMFKHRAAQGQFFGKLQDVSPACDISEAWNIPDEFGDPVAWVARCLVPRWKGNDGGQ